MGSRVAAVAAALALVVAPAASAAADPATDGFWYFDVFHIQDAHDAGLTGDGVTIAVFDSQINLDVPTLQGADIEVQDSNCYDDAGELIPPTSTDLEAEHGTNVVSYLVGSGAGYGGQTGIKGIVPDAKILFTVLGEAGEAGSASVAITCNAEDPTDPNTSFADGVYAAIEAGADIISMSVSISTSSASELALATALHEGIVVISSVSNDSLSGEARGGFPSLSNGVVGVQSLDSAGLIQGDHTDPSTDVAGPGVDVVWQGGGSWEEQKYSTGTSIATPIVAGFVALAAQKYPDATRNQLVQTLIRNTDAEDHPLNFDPEFAYGYGVASATHMLKVDPTQYEDVNPLIDDDPSAEPSAALIANPPATLEEYINGSSTGAPGEPGDPGEADGIPVLPIVLGIVGLLVVVGIVILIIVLAARRTRTSTDSSRRGPA